MTRKVVGRFKGRRPRRPSRVAVGENPRAVEALNAQMERAVTATLHDGLRLFRADVGSADLERGYNLQDYAKLMRQLPYANLDAATAKAASQLGTMVPQTAEEVRMGIAGGVRGDAAYDPLFTQRLDLSGQAPKARGGKEVDEDAKALARRMDADNPALRPYTAARQQKYLLDLTAPDRAQVQALANQATKQGWNSKQTAERLGEVIGLSPRQSKSLDNMRARMEKDGLDKKNIDAKIASQSEAYLADRAQLIAITEVRSAGATAQLEAWLSMQEQGLISSDAQKQWVAGAEDPCPKICEPTDGQIVLLADDFTLGNGKPCSMPGQAHPRCRCGCVLLDDEDDDRSGRNRAAFRPQAEVDKILGRDTPADDDAEAEAEDD